MSMARVIEGAVVSLGLPDSGTLADGRTVSNYAALDPATLTAEGWVPVVETVPTFDAETHRLVDAPTVEVVGGQVNMTWAVEVLPAPVLSDAERIADLEAQLQTLLDALEAP